MTERNVLIMDYRDSEGTISAFAEGYAEGEVDAPEGIINGTSVAFVSDEDGNYVAVTVADDAGNEMLAIISGEQFFVSSLAVTGDIPAVEESVDALGLTNTEEDASGSTNDEG